LDFRHHYCHHHYPEFQKKEMPMEFTEKNTATKNNIRFIVSYTNGLMSY